MTMASQASGARGEQLAADFLCAQGFTIVGRNVRTRSGEIDIIARYRNELHFVEVKTRASERGVDPLEQMHEAKQARCRRMAEWYLARNPWDGTTHLSVVGIDLRTQPPQIEWVPDAME